MSFSASSGTFVQTQTASTATAVTFTSQTVGTGWTVATGSTSVANMALSPMADWCIIQFSFTNAANISLWVTTDGGVTGGATIGGQACIQIPPTGNSSISTGMAIITNIQAQYNWNILGGTATYYDGNEQTAVRNGLQAIGASVNDQSYTYARTAQSANTGTHLWNVAPNWLSYIPSASATGNVTVTFQ